MTGIEVLFTILSVVLLAAYVYFLSRRHSNVWKALVLSLALVIFESSLWHIVFGEQFAAELCGGVDSDAVFGFFHCAEFSYDFLLDTYEITVSLSISILAGLMFIFVRPKQVVQFTMLCLLIVLSLLLLFLPYSAVKDYAMPYDIVAALISLTIIIDELYDHFTGEVVVYEQVEEGTEEELEVV